MSPIVRYLSFPLLFLAVGAGGVARELEESYQVVQPPQPTLTESGIEVMEFFWYGCPHCYNLEPYLDKWLGSKPEDVSFVRVPAILNKSWIPHARAYYTARKLGVLEKIHRPLFEAMHAEHRPLFSEDDLRGFFEGQGVDGEEFTRVYRSYEVEARLKQALVLARNYKITGVPTLIVNGKYSTSGSLAGTFDGMLDVVNHLVERERAAGAQ